MALIRPEAELMRKYGLTDEELEQEFSEEHIQEITKILVEGSRSASPGDQIRSRRG